MCCDCNRRSYSKKFSQIDCFFLFLYWTASVSMAPAKKKTLPKPLPEGFILNASDKTRWRLGKIIGQGGFGLIYLGTTCLVYLCLGRGRWMKLNRLVMWSGAVRSRKSLRRQCAMHAAACCFVDSFNSGVNSVKLNVKSNCVVYFDSCWCFLSTHSLQGCGQARCSRYRVCHQVGEWTESAACLKVP